MDLKSTTYKEGSRPACPHCNSVQVKAMSNQPKKYPYPEGSFLTPKKELEALREIWHKGYDCKKCGNEFIAIPWTMTPLWENNEKADQLNTALSGKTKKKSGFFGKLLGWIFLVIIAFIAYSVISSPSESSKSTPTSTETTQTTNNAPREEDPLKQEFSKEAEEAAHAYIPPTTESEQKSIADSQDQNDTLSIKTTVRAKDE